MRSARSTRPASSRKSSGKFFNAQRSGAGFFAPAPVQAKLSVSQPGDPYEREADAVAERVMQGQQATAITPVNAGALHRKCAECEKEDNVQRAAEEEEPMQMQQEEEEPMQMQQEEEEPIQMQQEEEEPVQMQQEEEEMVQGKQTSASASPGPAFAARLQARSGKGEPLSSPLRQQMERGIGVDFSGVRIHTDSDSVQMNREIRAHAFTRGQDIYFNTGRFQPGSTEGQRLLAHELTHVVQQKGGGQPLLQREYAIEPSHPDATAPELTETQIADAIAHNRRQLRHEWEISLIRDVIGLDAEPAEIDQDFIHSIAEYQAQYGISADGKIGAITASRLSRELRSEAQGLDRDESRELNRSSRRMGTRAMRIRVNQAAARNDNRGSATFGVMWDVPDTAANGYVIQHVRFSGNVQNCSGTAVTSVNAAPPNNYWEAWRVVNGRVRCGNLSGPCTGSDDTFTTATEAAGTRGTVGVTGRVSFFPDYRLDSGWSTATGHPAGVLPHRATAPPEWNEGETMSHQMTVTYNNCVSPATTAIRSHP